MTSSTEAPTAQTTLLETIRRFVDTELLHHHVERRFLTRPFRESRAHLDGLRAKARALGIWAPFLPVEHGGLGLSLIEYAHVSAVLGRSPIGHYVLNCQAPDAGNMELLLQHGTPEQQARWLAPLARGEIRSCFSMTEPDLPGSNPVWMNTTAVADGNDYVIDGHKWFTSSADGAAFAIVMAVTNPEAPMPHERASLIIVPLGTPGFTLERNIQIMGDEGDDYASHGEVRYSGVRVPRANRIGAEGAGFRLAQERLGPGRIHHCMRWIGICERAFHLMCERAASRQLAPGTLLGSKQTVQNWIAESRAEIDAATLLVLDAARKIEAHGTQGAREAISTIKFYVANVLQQVLDRALQVHGALGMTDDTPLAYWYRHERGARIYDGPDEVHKAMVARRILKRYGADVGG